MEPYTTGSGQRLMVHSEAPDCSRYPCVIHHPSNHSMTDFPTLWRSDRRIMERVCPHGIGHPDPDDAAFRLRMGLSPEDGGTVHGCDGCCFEEYGVPE